MLVLSRKCGERIVIGPNIELTVVQIEGDRVRLGFVAPRETPIHRREVQQRLQREGHDEPPADEHAATGRR